MALLHRISRAIDTLSRPQLDSRSLFGAQGEEYARQIIARSQVESLVMNPIIPDVSSEWRNPRESDFLIYTLGTLFCVEIKRYKGVISYAPHGSLDLTTRQGSRKHFQTGDFKGNIDADILQEKTGKHGERLIPKRHPNPMKKTKTFIYHLKKYLSNTIDRRFREVYIIPIVAFVETEADIRTIHSVEHGMIYVRELPAFFQLNAHPVYAQKPFRWISEGLQRVPTSDLIVTTANEPFKGFIVDPILTFKNRHGGVERLPFDSIQSICLEHTDFFSDYDVMTVYSKKGKPQKFECRSGVVRLTGFDGEPQTHKLRNVTKVVVGSTGKEVVT